MQNIHIIMHISLMPINIHITHILWGSFEQWRKVVFRHKLLEAVVQFNKYSMSTQATFHKWTYVTYCFLKSWFCYKILAGKLKTCNLAATAFTYWSKFGIIWKRASYSIRIYKKKFTWITVHEDILKSNQSSQWIKWLRRRRLK